MTAVNNAVADEFIERLPNDLRFYLVYGADEDRTYVRSKAIVSKTLLGDLDPIRLVRLDGNTVARDRGVLAAEANAPSMFEGNRVIWIDAQGRDLTPALEPLFARPPVGCTIVVRAAQLKKGHPLRSAFERMPHAAAVECYPNGDKSLNALIDAETKAAGVAMNAEARRLLAGLLGTDRQTAISEISKLMTYALGQQRIEVDDVEAIVSDATSLGVDEFVDHVLIGERRTGAISAARFFGEGGDGDQLVVRLGARLTLLHRLRLEMDQGKTPDIAWQSLTLRLSIPTRRLLAGRAERWTSDSIARRFILVRRAAARARGEARLRKIVATHVIWALLR